MIKSPKNPVLRQSMRMLPPRSNSPVFKQHHPDPNRQSLKPG